MNRKIQNLDRWAAAPRLVQRHSLEVTSSLSSLWSLLSELRDERARNRQQIQHLAVDHLRSFSEVMFSLYLIVSYAANNLRFSCVSPMCYPYNSFDRLCDSVYEFSVQVLQPCPLPTAPLSQETQKGSNMWKQGLSSKTCVKKKTQVDHWLVTGWSSSSL